MSARIRTSVLSAAVLAAVAGSAGAQPISYDGFNYTPLTTLGGKNGGSGWSGAWGAAPGLLNFDVSLIGLNYESLNHVLNTSGRAATFVGPGNPPNNINGFSRRALPQSIGQIAQSYGGTVYLSFLIRQDPLSLIPFVPSQTTGTWLGIDIGGVYIGKEYNAPNLVIESTSGQLTRPSVSAPTVGRTNLVLVEIQNNVSGPETMRAWINPPLGTYMLPTTADISPAGPVGEISNSNVIGVEAGGLTINQIANTIAGRIDEIRIGRSPWDVLPATLKPALCRRLGHGIEITARVPGQLGDVTIQEKYKVRAAARSKTCVQRSKASSGGWVSVSQNAAPTNHQVNASAPGSWAMAKAGISLLNVGPDVLIATTHAETDGAATTSGCNANRRKKASFSRASAYSKVRALDNPSGDVLRNTNGSWLGRWRNCVGSSTARTPRLLRDPVILRMVDTSTANALNKPIIDITNLVWDGETAWVPSPNPDLPEPRLENTARNMNFTATVGSDVIADLSLHGVLEIETRNGVLTRLIATGPFAHVHQHLTLGQSSTFSIPMPEIKYELTTHEPSGSRHSSIEAGGGATVADLGSDAIHVGCEFITHIAEGYDDADVSAPRDGRVEIGIQPHSRSVMQEFTVPPGVQFLDSLAFYAYQEGRPENDTTPIHLTALRIWVGVPQQAVMIADLGARPSDIEFVDVHAAESPQADSGLMRIFECSADLQIPISPGSYWIEFAAQGEPSYGPISLVPCRYSNGNAMLRDQITGSMIPIIDPGNNTPLGLVMDVYAGEGNDCPADFNGDGFIDFFDLNLFFEAFDAGAVTADFNADGFIDFFDLDLYIEAFEAGC
ncbi:MAG: hypothetical protein HRU70_01390 [Phycisphaeraceae bacterium]|nr:MAG: hypothetical protein HRU70_01390 [Phycisphaeraceae bacterium]